MLIRVLTSTWNRALVFLWPKYCWEILKLQFYKRWNWLEDFDHIAWTRKLHPISDISTCLYMYDNLIHKLSYLPIDWIIEKEKISEIRFFIFKIQWISKYMKKVF